MAETVMIVPAREGYDRWAPRYDLKGNTAVSLKNAEVRRLLDPVRGLQVIDLGCGTGQHAAAMAAEGAAVTAVDFSAGMLSEARRRPGAGGVRFMQRDLNEPLPFADGFFDRVLCSCALEHVERLDLALAEMGRVCRPTGWIGVVEMHPGLRRHGVAAEFRDPSTGARTRPRSCGYQVGQFVMAALRAGLRMEEISEPGESHSADGPLLLVMKLRPRGVS
jgi:ubiquinone/menaquinone biosynthesis C-methylase UbiE